MPSRQAVKQRSIATFGYAGMLRHPPSGLYLTLYRVYDALIGLWRSRDPMGEAGGINQYGHVGNRPSNTIDPLGLEPVKDQAGTILIFQDIMNSSPSGIGKTTGGSAAAALSRLGDTSGLTPVSTPYFNTRSPRYIYTTKGGWIDMVHFLFYAGKAKKYKDAGSECPVSDAVRQGYHQEYYDSYRDPWSAYSYEDLPSDKAGADFGANFFDPTSSDSLAEQVAHYLDNLGATSPYNAPNYSSIPNTDSHAAPTAKNHSTTPMYTTP